MSQAVAGVYSRKNVYVIAAIAAIGGLLFGYDTGVIASALLFIDADFSPSALASGMIVGAVPVGAIFGAVVAGWLTDRYGRRRIVLIAALLFIAGALASAAADSVTFLIFARIVIGLGIGLASATCPVYISEVAPAAYRGRLVTLFQLMVTIGILVAYLVGLAFEPSAGWRWMLGLGAVPGIILAIGVIRLPQSPRWLMIKGRHKEARETLVFISGGDEAAADSEIAEIDESLKIESKGWRDLLSPAVKMALVVGVGLAILQQITGINTVIYYAPTIVQDAGIGSDASAILAAVGVGIVNVGMTIFSLWLLNRYGRRPLLLFGVAVMALALVALGFAFTLAEGSSGQAVVAIASLMIYVGAFAISLGPIFWLLNSEIYPLAVRGKAAGIGTMANWLFNFIVSLTFLSLLDELGKSGAFWLYAAIAVVAFVFVFFLVPETKGKTLEQIEQEFRNRSSKGRKEAEAA